MATRVAGNQHQEFDALVTAWENRRRTQKILRWLPFVLVLSIMVAILVAAGMRVFLQSSQLSAALVALLVIVVGVTSLFSIVWFAPRKNAEFARSFDQIFGLQEKVSTAYELIGGEIHTHPQILDLQVADALHDAQQVDHQAYLPLDLRSVMWVLIPPLLLILGIVLLLPGLASGTGARSAEQAAAISEAADEIRDITETVATDTSLQEEERESLLETLERSLDDLEAENTTAEEAFATMSEVASDLRQQADELSTSAQGMQSSLQQAAQQLFNQRAEAEATSGIPELNELLNNAEESLQSMSSQSAEELADALSEASEQMELTDAEMAELMQSASDALREGDMESAQESLQEAEQRAQNLQEQQEQQQQAAENMDQAADQAEQSAQEIAESDQQEQQGDRPQEQQEGDEGQPQSGSQESDNPQSSQQSDAEQTGQNSGEPGESEGDPQSAEQASPEESSSANQNAGSSSTSQEQASFATESDSVNENNVESAGETEFERIYAPQRLGGQGTESITLESDMGDTPSIEGEFSDNPAGESRIPYNQVFSEYRDSANQALDNNYIPLGLRDIVRDYFSSLEPR